jgi:hypothetical protein
MHGAPHHCTIVTSLPVRLVMCVCHAASGGAIELETVLNVQINGTIFTNNTAEISEHRLCTGM